MAGLRMFTIFKKRWMSPPSLWVQQHREYRVLFKKNRANRKNKLENQNQETNTIKTKKLRKSMRWFFLCVLSVFLVILLLIVILLCFCSLLLKSTFSVEAGVITLSSYPKRKRHTSTEGVRRIQQHTAAQPGIVHKHVVDPKKKSQNQKAWI